jgi:hypothetical protein
MEDRVVEAQKPAVVAGVQAGAAKINEQSSEGDPDEEP